VKRIHEYKRQLLNVLHVIHLYDRIKRGDTADWTPRCVLIGGKAAPGYAMAKRIIRLVTAVADVVNHDPSTNGLLRLAFLPDYRVSAMEVICPAADLSEQISTAGKEASGTGNMKFMMNGAITIGTLDGANIEIMEEVGQENFFLFGLTTPEVNELRSNGYNPWDYYQGNAELKLALDMIGSGYFSPDEPLRFQPVVDALLTHGDHYMLLADYSAYIACHDRVRELYRSPDEWSRKAIINVASMGKFSSDRTIREYAERIWHVAPVKTA
jgi:starch phosphorylase